MEEILNLNSSIPSYFVLSKDGRYLAYADDGSVFIIDFENRCEYEEEDPYNFERSGDIHLCFTPDSKSLIIAPTQAEKISIVEMESSELNSPILFSYIFSVSALACTENKIFIGDNAGFLRIYDYEGNLISDKQEAKVFEKQGVNRIEINPNNSNQILLESSNYSGTVYATVYKDFNDNVVYTFDSSSGTFSEKQNIYYPNMYLYNRFRGKVYIQDCFKFEQKFITEFRDGKALFNKDDFLYMVKDHEIIIYNLLTKTRSEIDGYYVQFFPDGKVAVLDFDEIKLFYPDRIKLRNFFCNFIDITLLDSSIPFTIHDFLSCV